MKLPSVDASGSWLPGHPTLAEMLEGNPVSVEDLIESRNGLLNLSPLFPDMWPDDSVVMGWSYYVNGNPWYVTLEDDGSFDVGDMVGNFNSLSEAEAALLKYINEN